MKRYINGVAQIEHSTIGHSENGIVYVQVD